MNLEASKSTVKLDVAKVHAMRRDRRWTLKALTAQMSAARAKALKMTVDQLVHIDGDYREINVRRTLHRSGRGSNTGEEFAFDLAAALDVPLDDILLNGKDGKK